MIPDIAELRRLLAEATPGPWHAGVRKLFAGALGREPLREIGSIGADADRDLIVAAINALPALLDEVERLRADQTGDATSYYRCLAIALGAKPEQMRSGLDRALYEKHHGALADAGLDEAHDLSTTWDALAKAEAERDAARAEIERLRGLLRDAHVYVFAEYAAEGRERDRDLLERIDAATSDALAGKDGER